MKPGTVHVGIQYKEISRISASVMTQFEDMKEMPDGIYMPNILKRR